MKVLLQATIGTVCLSLAALLAGCAQPPVDRLRQAQELVDAAKAAGAPEYAMEEWSRLDVAFAQAKEELANQEKAMAIFRAYLKADEMLRRVAEDAERVRALTNERKVAAKAAAETSEKEATAALTSAQDLLSKSRAGRHRTANANVEQELNKLRGSLGSIHQLIEEGDYVAAEARANALKERAATASEKLAQKTKERKT